MSEQQILRGNYFEGRVQCPHCNSIIKSHHPQWPVNNEEGTRVRCYACAECDKLFFMDDKSLINGKPMSLLRQGKESHD